MAKSDQKVWDRFPNETEASWRAFVAYRDQVSPRNIEKLAVGLGLSAHTLHGYSSEHLWAERVAHYDAWLDRKRTRAVARANEKQAERLARKQLEAAEAAVDVARLGLKRTLDELKKFPTTEIPPNQLARLLRDGTQMARLVLGETTERVETTFDLTKLTDEQAAQLDLLVTEASKPHGT